MLFLAFLGVVIVFSTTLIILRLPMLKSKNELDSFLSRESSFLFNNLVLLGITFATFWGTIFPIISEAVRGVKITVGPPFYNQVNVPIGLALLALVGIGPVIAWRKATWSNLKRNFTKPVVAGLIGAGILFPFVPLTDKAEIYSYLTFILCIFVLATIFIEFYKGSAARRAAHEDSYLGSVSQLVWKNKRRYGGYIVHVGVVLIFAGIAGSQAYDLEFQKHMQIGETVKLRDYDITYERLLVKEQTSRKTRVIAQLGVMQNGRRIWTGNPEKEFYKKQNQPVSEVDLLSTWKEDLYLILADFNPDNSSATIKIHINPMVSWMWTGGWIIAFGTSICMWPDRLEARRRLERLKRQETIFVPAQE
jgi:cytochrome c-type biogenesis protein CcmF